MTGVISPTKTSSVCCVPSGHRQLPSSRLRELALRLAHSIQRIHSEDAATLAWLWERGGDDPRVIDTHELAGDRALDALTFAQAERHYSRALDLLPSADVERVARLRVQRGHALVSLGRVVEAAEAFQAASEVAQ